MSVSTNDVSSFGYASLNVFLLVINQLYGTSENVCDAERNQYLHSYIRKTVNINESVSRFRHRKMSEAQS